MSGLEAWLGVCHLVSGGDTPESFEVRAAVFCASREAFEAAVRDALEPRDFQLLWAEEVLPATNWMSRHPSERAAIAMAPKVHAGHVVEFGPMKGVGADGEPEAAPEYLTITQHEIPSLPAQDGVPFWDKSWIASELKELLFGQPESGQQVRTYFIVDATLRKNIMGVFDLDALDVPIKCLFKGDAAEDLKEAAPYLIDMTLPDGAWDNRDAVPAFHKDFFAKHWGQNTGIFIRSTALMSEVWGHFRKFTLVPREGQKSRVFVRFWDEQYARLYFPHIAGNRERVAMWFLRDGFFVQSLLADHNAGKTAQNITLNVEYFANDNLPSKSFEVTEYDLKPFYKERDHKDLLKLADALKQGFPQHMKNYSQENIVFLIKDPLKRMRDYGFSRQSNLYTLAAWSMFFGKTFEQKDRTGQLLDICNSSMNEVDKMSALKKRMEQLSVPKETTA